jgi:sugar lactone lactonase YvrE
VRLPRADDEAKRHAAAVSVDIYVDARARLAEGPRWDAEAGVLLWVDIERGEVHRGEEVLRFDERVGCVAPVAGGGLLVATARRLVLEGATVAEFPHADDLRANDGVCDDRGRLWVGTMAVDERDGDAALYRFDGRLELILEGVGLSNGIGWSPDRTRMYYVDSLTQRVDVFDYDGDVANRRPFVTIDRDDGIPDGLAVDDEGGVWVALWDGACVRRYDEDGRLAEELAIPGRNVTACCFGGVDGRSLFVTTAEPDGRIYVADVGVGGPPAQPFRSTAPSDAEPTSAR